MVYRRISQDLKERALWLLGHDYIPEDVAEILGVSERSLARWKANELNYGSVMGTYIFIFWRILVRRRGFPCWNSRKHSL